MGLKRVRQHCPQQLVGIWTFLPHLRRRIDTANLLLMCASANAQSYTDGDYKPALRMFKRVLQAWIAQSQSMLLVFDGVE